MRKGWGWFWMLGMVSMGAKVQKPVVVKKGSSLPQKAQGTVAPKRFHKEVEGSGKAANRRVYRHRGQELEIDPD